MLRFVADTLTIGRELTIINVSTTIKYFQSPNDHYIHYQHNECVAFLLCGV